MSTPHPFEDIDLALSSAGPGCASVKIGIVDGLPDLTHPVLRGATIDVLSTMIPDGDCAPDAHGTGVCSLLFGTGGQVRGLAPGCSGLVLPIFFNGAARERPRAVSQLDLARAIEFGVENGVRILNISAGQKVAAAEPDTHLEQALRRCVDAGILVVGAAGNDGCACLHLPASLPSVLAVGACGSDGRPSDMSNWGAAYRENGILAPGENLTVADDRHGVTTASGTSFAAAIVSGVAARLLSLADRERYGLDGADIRAILLDSAAPCTLDGPGACDPYLAGRLDAAAALARVHAIGTGRRAARASGRPIEFDVETPAFVTDRETIAMDQMTLSPNSERDGGGAAVMPSACGCQHKQEDESPAAVRPQGGPAPTTRGQPPSGDGLSQQGCGCGGGQPPQIVYALGSLWFDFGTEARHDLFVQQLGDPMRANNPLELIAFLRDNPQFASGLTFILMQEQIPLYAIQPAGAFAPQAYTAMLDALVSSLEEGGGEQRVSIPGFISGATRLLNGMTVPVVFPDLRGMYKWRSDDLIEATRVVAGHVEQADEAILDFLNRVYYELRNLGVAPQDRAVNFAATNAYQARRVFADAASKSLVLDSIRVVKSPICRPDSDCWDVELIMFDDDDERRPNRVYRSTVDVSEVVPVTVGTVRTWAARAA